MTIEILSRQKRGVKNELKNYDQTFAKLFSRQPCRSDKEPLRPLYMYYKRLKHILSKRLTEQSGGN
jgi:hypothetical protein